MPTLSNRSNGTPSITLALQEQVAARRAAGTAVISLAAGAPDLPPPGPVRTWLADPIGLSDNDYTPVRGKKSLRLALGEFLQRHGWTGDDETQVLISNGAKQALFSALAATTDENKDVLILSPHWPSYTSMVSLLGARARLVPVPAALEPETLAAALDKAYTPQASTLVFSSPSNPTGEVLSAACLAALSTWTRDRGLFVIADETYGQLHLQGSFRAPSVLPLLSAEHHMLQIGSASKTFSLMGARIGWATGSPRVIERLSTIQSHLSSNVSNQAQALAEAALATDDTELQHRADIYTRRRDILTAGVRKLPWLRARVPAGGLFVWCELLGNSDGADIARRLLDELGIAIVPGADFGRRTAVRLSFAATEEQLHTAVERLLTFQH